MFTAVKVFSTTKSRDRETLGERITEWIKNAKPEIERSIVVQSSDREFHCFTIVFFYR